MMRMSNNNIHIIEIEMTGDEGYARELSKILGQVLENYVVGNPPKNRFHWTATLNTEMTAVLIERRAKDDYIEDLDWSHIVEVIKENGELHDYHMALGMEEARGYVSIECDVCGFNGQYWSVLDNDSASYLHTGRNSHNKRDCVYAVFDFINDGAEEPWDYENMDMSELEELLESLYNYELVDHDKLILMADDSQNTCEICKRVFRGDDDIELRKIEALEGEIEVCVECHDGNVFKCTGCGDKKMGDIECNRYRGLCRWCCTCLSCITWSNDQNE